MQVSVQQEQLSHALRVVGRAVASRNTIPILSGIYLEARAAELILRATDLEAGMETTIPAEVRATGAIVLPARYLTELVRRLPPGPVQVTVDPRNFTADVAATDSQHLMHGYDPGQFPADPVFGPASGPLGEGITVGRQELCTLLRETSFAASHDEARPFLTGIHLTIQTGRATAVATDGAVIAYSETPIHNPAGLAANLIVPGRSVTELTRLLTDAAADACTVWPQGNHLLVRIGPVTLVTRLLDGQYPDLLPLLPPEFGAAVVMDRLRFIAGCERAALVTQKGRVRLAGSERELQITVRTPEVGQVTERVPAAIQGSVPETAVDVGYVLEGVRAMESEELLVEFSGRRGAIRFRSHASSPSFFALMPLIT